jgi:hypothetical protein
MMQVITKETINKDSPLTLAGSSTSHGHRGRVRKVLGTDGRELIRLRRIKKRVFKCGLTYELITNSMILVCNMLSQFLPIRGSLLVFQ